MKQMLGILLALVLLCSACPVSTESAGAIDALLEQLSAYLAVSDQAYSIYIDTCQQILDFCKQRDYSTLVSARLACNQAQEVLNALSAPALTLSDEALLELMKMDVETDALETELQRFAIFVPSMPGTMSLYEDMLYSSLLNSSEVDILAQHVTMKQQCAELMMAYLCALVNDILLPVADQPQVAAFWAAIPERYSKLGSCQAPWETDPDALNDRYMRIDQEYATQTSLESELVGRYAYAIEQYNRSVVQDDTETLNRMAIVIDGMPTMLPLPDNWLDPKNFTAYAYKESPEGLPKTITLWTPNVSLSLFDEYAQTLLNVGASLYKLEGSDEEGWKYVLIYDRQVLMMQWDPLECASITYEPAFLSLELFDYLLCQ